MKFVQAFLILTLLLVSSQYRKKWRQAIERLSEANDFVEASLRRLDARHNGGRPRIRVLEASALSDILNAMQKVAD